eukprot:COSAG02_NODE_467_length_21771_cov_39.020303_12_plen_1850_part_00
MRRVHPRCPAGARDATNIEQMSTMCAGHSERGSRSGRGCVSVAHTVLGAQRQRSAERRGWTVHCRRTPIMVLSTHHMLLVAVGLAARAVELHAQDPSCVDDEAFSDELGSSCTEWVGFDCGDQQQASDWGYSSAGVEAVLTSCLVSCGLCDPAVATTSPSLAQPASIMWEGIPRHGASPPPLREMTLLSRQPRTEGNVVEVVVWGGTTGTQLNDGLYLLRTDTFVWRKMPITSRARPVARTQHASAMQSDRSLIVIGGADSSNYMLSDVWSIDLDDRFLRWRELSHDGSAPMPARIGHGAAMLNATTVLIMGGNSPEQYGVPDLWAFDTGRDGRAAWTLLQTWEPGHDGPRACYLPLLVPDRDGRGVRAVWGTTGNALDGSKLADLNATQTWRFDLPEQRWERVHTSGTPPPDLWAPLLTTLPNRSVAIGGFGWMIWPGAYVNPVDSVFKLGEDEEWVHLAAPADESCVDDPAFTDEFGEACSAWAGYDCGDREQAIEWGYADSTVGAVMAACPSSCGLCNVCDDDPAFTDEFGEACSAWAGYDCGDREQAIEWGYADSTVDAVMAACPSSCGLCDIDQFRPPPRSDGGMVAISESEFLVFGGWGASSMLNDLVLFDSKTFAFTSVAEQSISPEARKGATLTSIGTETLLFGGETDDGRRLQDLWSLSEETGWQRLQVVGESPARRSFHAAAVSGRKMCIHGGLHGNGWLLNDMWCYDVYSHSWGEIQTDRAPPPRMGHTMVALSGGSSQWLLFGGTGDDDVSSDTTWTIDLQVDSIWKQIHCRGSSPSPRKGHGAAQIHVDGRDMVVVIGGTNTASEEQVDIWLLDHDDLTPMTVHENGTEAAVCHRDDGTTLRAVWYLVENYAEQPVESCDTYSECDFYLAGRAWFNLASSVAGSSFLLSGGVVDWGTQVLDDVVHVRVQRIDTGRYRTSATWVSVEDFPARRMYSTSSTSGADMISFGGTERVWLATELVSTTNEAHRLSFPPCDPYSPNATLCVPCSPGFVFDNSTEPAVCTPCPVGTYSEFNGRASVCVDCPAGYRGFIIAASSRYQCSPCPAGTRFDRELGCVPCLNSQHCPIATIQPEFVANTSEVSSLQPKTLQSREQQVWFLQKIVYILTTVALIVLSTLFSYNVVIKPHSDKMRRFDFFFKNAHAAGFYSDSVGFHAQEKKTTVGGWFSLLTLVSGLSYVVVLFMPVLLNNTEETQSLQPNLIWESLKLEHQATMQFMVQLSGYRGQCAVDAIGTCAPGITVSSDTSDFPVGQQRCFMEQQQCTLWWVCESCKVNGAVGVSVAFLEAHSFTHEIKWSAESESSFVGGSGPDQEPQNSSLRASVQPSAVDRSFRGQQPTRITIVARPSVYTFQTTAQQEVGYHVEYVATALGSEVSESTFNDANGVRLFFLIEQAPATLATVRVVHQSVFVFISNSFAAIIGLLSIFSWFMTQVERWFYSTRPFESLDRVDIMVADWMRVGAPRVFEQLNQQYFTTRGAEEKFLAVRARCLQSDIFSVFDQFDLQRKGYLSRDEFGAFIKELDIVLTPPDRQQLEEFFEDGKVTFAEFKHFYLDYTQRTEQQRARVVSARLESTPRGRVAQEKWKSKVRTLGAVRRLAVAASSGQDEDQNKSVSTSEIMGTGGIALSLEAMQSPAAAPVSPVRVELTGSETLRDPESGRSYDVYNMKYCCFDGSIVTPKPKRFSEFYALRSSLIKSGRANVEKVPFPPRKISRSTSRAQSTVGQRQHGLQSWLNEVLRAYACDPHIAEFLLPPEADTTVTKTSIAAIDSSADSLVQQHQHEKELTTAGILKSSGGKLQPAEATTETRPTSPPQIAAEEVADLQAELQAIRNRRPDDFEEP